MTETHSSEPLLTLEVARAWEAERREARIRLAELDRKVEGFRLMFPDLAARLFGQDEPKPAPARSARSAAVTRHRRDPRLLPLSEMPMTEACMVLLEGEAGGRPPRWFREKMLAIPGLAERVKKSPNVVSTALGRLVDKGRLIKRGGESYCIPEIAARIDSGEMVEEAVSGGGETFNAIMHRAMREHGRPFKAADALAVAMCIPALAEKIGEQPSRVYSWLSREVFKHKLRKDGEFYSYPSERDGALNGQAASAPSAGEVAASPIDSQPALRLIS